MSWIYVLTICIFSTVLWDFSSSNGILGAIYPSPENNVGLGDTAMFTCRVWYRDRRTQNLLWRLSYRDPNSMMVKHNQFPANLTRINLPETPWVHGQYTLSYLDGTFEVLNLSIYNVTKGDDNIEVTCMYQLSMLSGVEDIIALSDAVQLNVWTKPKCNTHFVGNVPTVITSTDIIQTLLNCSSGTDALVLTLHRIDNGMRVQRGSSRLFSNYEHLGLTIFDYGREYICVATIPGVSIAIFELTCSVFPYFPQPKLTIDKSTISGDENVTMYCTYDAIPKPKSHFFWYINTTLLNDIENVTAVNITTTDIDSMIFFGSAYLPVGNTNVTCETVILGINRANTTVTVMVEPPVEPTERSPTHPNGVTLVAILISVGCIVFVIIVIAVSIWFYLRKRQLTSQTGEQFKTSSDVITEPGIGSNCPSSGPNEEEANPPISQYISPVYATQINTDSFTGDVRRVEVSPSNPAYYEDVDASSKSAHYEDVDASLAHKSNTANVDKGTPYTFAACNENEGYEDIPINIKSASSEITQGKKPTNAEGHLYTDLDISNVNQSVYTELKM